MFLNIESVRPLAGHTLRLKFNDGAIKDVDLSGHLNGPAFKPLKEIDYFRRVEVNPQTGTIEWPNGADFEPVFLYDIGRLVHQMA